MNIILAKNHSLGIKDQIKRQIRNMVKSGRLVSGQMLPSAKDMAILLNVNRNTVASAYRELVTEGSLETIKGSGTFVKAGKISQRTNELVGIFDKAFQKAMSSGFNREEISEFLLTYIATHLENPQGQTVLVVECNQEAMEHISSTLRQELAVQTKGLLIHEIEQTPSLFDELLPEVDLIVCGFNHIEELKKAVSKIPVEIVAVMLKPETRIINELFQLSPGTHVGFVCANQRSTETFYKSQFFSSGSSLTRIWAGMDNPRKVREMLDQCDVVFATHYVFERMHELAGPDKRVIEVELSIDTSSINYVKERLCRKGIQP
jgi:DNA-binding transcriptional regulator YhcF (GntR family)